MKIYFNKNKEAYGYKIKSYIATTTEELWNELCEDRSSWDIIDGEFVDLRQDPTYISQKLAEAKALKYAENDTKAEEARTSKTFTLTLQDKECEFDTQYKTQTDLLTAFSVCSSGETYDGWVCNNGIVIDLTMQDLMQIQVMFKELSNVYPRWNYYKNLIDIASTKEAVEAIVIDYDIELELSE